MMAMTPATAGRRASSVLGAVALTAILVVAPNLSASTTAGSRALTITDTSASPYRDYRDSVTTERAVIPPVITTTTTAVQRRPTPIPPRASRSAVRTPRPTTTAIPVPPALSAPDAPATGPRGTGERMAAERGWTGPQWTCLDRLWGVGADGTVLEAAWNPHALNRHSGAGGVPQALPPSKMGADWYTNTETQIRWGLDYIAGRYHDPCGALAARLHKGWY